MKPAAAADTVSRMSAWREEIRQQARLALPVVLVQVGLMSLNVVDNIMVGHVEGDAARQIAAVSVGGLYVWLFMGASMGILMALDPLVAQAAGAGDHDSIARSMQRGLLLALLLSVPIGLIVLFVEPVLRSWGQADDVVPLAATFARWQVWSVPAFLGFVVLRQSLQALHRLRPIVLAIVVGNVVNALLDWVLIHGHLGLPALRSEGCAIATSLSRWLMFVLLLGTGWPALARYLRPVRREAARWPLLLRQLRLGLPIGVMYLMEMGAFAFVTVTMGSIGATQVAGHQLTLNLASLSFMVPLGISAAASVRVGHAVGRRDHAGMRRATGVAIVAGAVTMAVFAAVFALAPRLLARCYTDDAGVIAMVALLLPVAAAFQVFDGIQIVCGGVLRGCGDLRVPMLIHLAGFWLLGIPLSLALAFRAGMGPRGLWAGLAVALAFVAAVLLLRVRWRSETLPERVRVDEAAPGEVPAP
ncbi:MAG TPA: MATE family efflux transporter [Planctomycetota bacterium]|nr:MATE family efflux transporter [Planctomycetota bacterium]